MNRMVRLLLGYFAFWIWSGGGNWLGICSSGPRHFGFKSRLVREPVSSADATLPAHLRQEMGKEFNQTVNEIHQ